MDTNLISEVKINEVLKPFEDNKDITVLELYKHVSSLYNKNNESFKVIADKLSMESNNNELDTIKPLGKYGDITINEAFLYLKDLKWEFILNNTRATIHTVPALHAVNFISFSLILKSYMKYVHNRPYDTNLNAMQRQVQQKIRNRNLAIFVFLGAPTILYCLRQSSISIKNVGSINFPLSESSSLALQSSGYSPSVRSDTQINNNNSSNIINSILLLSNINKKIPNWVKLLFKLLLFSILVLKLLGFNSILDVFNNLYYIKIFSYISGSLAIIYQLFNLYLLYKFSNKNINISEILPNFIINWLKEFEVICSSKESINEFKNICYIQILIYILILILITLLL